MPTKTKKKEPETLYGKVIEKFNEYTNVTGTILEDYMCGDEGMFVKLAEADTNFKYDLEELLLEEEHNEKKLREQVATLYDNGELETNAFLNTFAEEDVMEWAASKGYATIRVENLADKVKLEEFVTTQLYPNYNDRDKYNL